MAVARELPDAEVAVLDFGVAAFSVFLVPYDKLVAFRKPIGVLVN